MIFQIWWLIESPGKALLTHSRMRPHDDDDEGKVKALANGFNICFNIHSILLNAVVRLLNDVERWVSKRFQHFIQQNLASGLVISFRPQLFSCLRHARRHFEMTMARAYVYNKVRSLLAVFVAFCSHLNHEDKKGGKGKTRQWIRRRDERGYFNNIVKELAIEDTAEYEFNTIKTWCEWVMPSFNEYWATSNRILLVNKSLVGIKLFLRKKD